MDISHFPLKMLGCVTMMSKYIMYKQYSHIRFSKQIWSLTTSLLLSKLCSVEENRGLLFLLPSCKKNI